ncbi:MAG: hypothetical protein PHP00_05865 [Thiotrichaceae bacterium]|nr:hypothetical protein [Thiotrichaceae bacterium]
MTHNPTLPKDPQSLNELYEEACLKQLLWTKLYSNLGWEWLKALSENWQTVSQHALHALVESGEKPCHVPVEEFVRHLPKAVQTEALALCAQHLNGHNPADTNNEWSV